ncbi:putative leucine-rich repeat domain-like protein, partial [Tanacetum coccineum]
DTKLRLDCNAYCRDGLWNHPSSVNLPCLKTLDLATNYPSGNTLKLILGCQKLESLSLKVYRFDKNEDLILDIPTLKILALTLPRNNSNKHKIVLEVPNLECLSIGGILCSLFVMEDLASLLEVSASFTYILSSLSLPTFPNLKRLDLRLDLKNISEKILISQILERSPELEHLNIETPTGCCWIENVSSCKLMKLETIKFKIIVMRECDMRFLKYILGNARGLQTLTMTCDKMCRKDERILCEKIATFPRVPL